MAGTAGKSEDKFINNVLHWTSTHGYNSVNQTVKTNIHQFCGNTRCCQVDLPRIRVDRDGWWERVRESVLSARLDDDEIEIPVKNISNRNTGNIDIVKQR